MEDFSDVALFRERVEKFEKSQRKYQKSPISKTTYSDKGSVIKFEANTPDIEEVASLGRNFRFFYAEKEPTNFQKILTKVRRRAQDEWACAYMDLLACQYKEAMNSSLISAEMGYSVTNRKIIDLWFNSEFFHSDKDKRRNLFDVHEAIGEAPSLFQLYVSIARCSPFIKSLYSVVHLLGPDHQFIYSPNHHFGQLQPSGKSH